MGFSTKFAVWYPRGEGLLAPLSSPTPTSSYQVTRQCRESRHRSAPASKILFWYSAVVCASCGGGMSAVANVGRDQHRVGMYVKYVQRVIVRFPLAAADNGNPATDEGRGVRAAQWGQVALDPRVQSSHRSWEKERTRATEVAMVVHTHRY